MSEYENDRSINLLKPNIVFYLHSNGAQSSTSLPLSAISRYPLGALVKVVLSLCEAFVSQQTSSPKHIACPEGRTCGTGNHSFRQKI